MIKIEKNIPITKPGRSKGELRTVMESMEIGDSILLTKENIQHARTLRSRCKSNFTERKQSDGTYRVWRIEE